jgi:hypothetical protein
MSQIKYEYWIGIVCLLEFGIDFFLLVLYHECHIWKKKLEPNCPVEEIPIHGKIEPLMSHNWIILVETF